MYIKPVAPWGSNLVRGRECRISDEDLVEVAVEGNLALGLRLGARHSLGALAEVEDLALDNLGREDLHSPGVLLAACRTAGSWTVVGVTWRIRVKLHSPCVP